LDNCSPENTINRQLARRIGKKVRDGRSSL
jgi:hypothetical protein